MTLWPRFAISRNDIGNLVQVKDMFTLRPAPGTEFRGGSCCGSQIGRGPHICEVLSGCITADSKTPMAQDPGLGPKAAAGRARAGPLAAALGPGPGSWAQQYKEKWKGYVNNFRQSPLKSVNSAKVD